MSAPGVLSYFKRLLGLGLMLAFAVGALQGFAQGFIDTTTGSTNAEHGIKDQGMSQRQRELLDRFRKGRVSSAKDQNSRYSGFGEFHDSDLDGIPDHAAGGKTNIEGVIADKFVNNMEGKTYDLRVKAMRTAINKDKCKGAKGMCFAYNPSAVLLNLKAAHVDKDDDSSVHRLYGPSSEVKALVDEVSKNYFNRTMADMRSALREGQDKSIPYATNYNGVDVFDVDMLRDEAMWNEDQKLVTYNRGWRLLRASRLAGQPADHASAFGSTDRSELMHEVETLIAKLGGADDATMGREIAQLIQDRSAILDQEVVKKDDGKEYALCTPQEDLCKPQADGKMRERTDIRDLNRNELGDKFTKLYSDAKDLVAKTKDPDRDKKIEQLTRCMNRDVWCIPTFKEQDKVKRAAAEKAGKYFVEATGDIGGAFDDARELMYVNMVKVYETPVGKLDTIFMQGGTPLADFNKSQYPEFFKEIEELQAEARELQKLDPLNYNPDTMTARQLFGIQKGVNDTFSNPDGSDYNAERKPTAASLEQNAEDARGEGNNTGFTGGAGAQKPPGTITVNPNPVPAN